MTEKVERPKGTKGRCMFCNASFGKRAMVRHLETCQARFPLRPPSEKPRQSKSFHLIVEPRPASMVYWLHLEAPAVATLEDLDEFLRDIWLECCGHLSAFTIEGKRYTAMPERSSFWINEDDEEDIARPLGDVLKPGMKFYHEYDFGTTTELVLKVELERPADTRSRKIKLLARNDPPDLRCSACGAPATQICPECDWEGKGLLCDACVSEHECPEDFLLPVVNSPRSGVCGYTGPA